MSFSVPMPADRAAWLAQAGDRAAHERIASSLECLHAAHVRPPPAGAPEAGGWLRIAVWNLERGRAPADAANLIAATGARVVLVSEADRGMARSANRDVVGELGARLRMGSAFGVEFVELGAGDPAEAASVGASPNADALHGNAVLSDLPLRDAHVLRLDGGGTWFTLERGQPRVGGRVAVIAGVELDGTVVTVASVHLESHSDAEDRARQLAAVLDGIDARDASGPAVLGGDLNTFGATRAQLADRATVRRLRASEPGRFAWPVDHEPLFAEAHSRGWTWTDANVAGPTTRHDPSGLPGHHPLRLDWILVRGLEAGRPVTVPATGPDGALSDHDMLAVSVRLPR